MDNLKQEILLNFLGWQLERDSQIVDSSPRDCVDNAVIDRIFWLNETIEEIKGGVYDNDK